MRRKMATSRRENPEGLNPEGLTLIEIMVALSIFALLVMSTSGVFANGLKTQAAAMKTDQASQITNQIAQQINQIPWKVLGFYDDDFTSNPLAGTKPAGTASLGPTRPTGLPAVIKPYDSRVVKNATFITRTTILTSAPVAGQPASYLTKCITAVTSWTDKGKQRQQTAKSCRAPAAGEQLAPVATVAGYTGSTVPTNCNDNINNLANTISSAFCDATAPTGYILFTMDETNLTSLRIPADLTFTVRLNDGQNPNSVRYVWWNQGNSTSNPSLMKSLTLTKIPGSPVWKGVIPKTTDLTASTVPDVLPGTPSALYAEATYGSTTVRTVNLAAALSTTNTKAPVRWLMSAATDVNVKINDYTPTTVTLCTTSSVTIPFTVTRGAYLASAFPSASAAPVVKVVANSDNGDAVIATQTSVTTTTEAGYKNYSYVYTIPLSSFNPQGKVTTLRVTATATRGIDEATASKSVSIPMSKPPTCSSNPGYNSATGHYYEWVTSANGLTYSQAAEQAKLRTKPDGSVGYLANITTPQEQDFFATYTAFPAAASPNTGWVGGSDRVTEGVWKWEFGPEAGQTVPLPGGTAWNSWNPTEPNNAYNNENCMTMISSILKWNDLNCDTLLTAYLVEYSKPKKEITGDYYYNGHYYRLVKSSTPLTWSQARAKAQTLYHQKDTGYLVNITSATEQEKLAAHVVTDNVWIGASDKETEGTWKWMDGPEAGTPFWSNGISVSGRYSNWYIPGQPDNCSCGGPAGVGEDYGHMSNLVPSNLASAFKWNDLNDELATTTYPVNAYIVEFGN
jgi:prepilin-type N-terminal cleavage/methylation domain-containing protein